MDNNSLAEKKEKLISKLKDRKAIKAACRTPADLEKVINNLKQDIGERWISEFSDPYSEGTTNLKTLGENKKINTANKKFMGEENIDNSIDILEKIKEIKGIKEGYESLAVEAAKILIEKLQDFKDLIDLKQTMSNEIHIENEVKNKDKKYAEQQLKLLKSGLTLLGKAKTEKDIRREAVNCDNLIKTYAWWRVRGTDEKTRKNEEKKKKNRGWALARVLFPENKLPSLLKTMPLLVSMYFIGHNTPLLSFSSVPVKSLRANAKLAIKNQIKLYNSNSGELQWYTGTAQNESEIRELTEGDDKSNKINEKEINKFFDELAAIQNPKKWEWQTSKWNPANWGKKKK